MSNASPTTNGSTTAKRKRAKTTGADAASGPADVVSPTGPPVAVPDEHAPRGAGAASEQPGLVDQAGTALVAAVGQVRSLLPEGRLPAYLAAGALGLTGLLDPPAVVGLALGYEALRRWRP